MKTIGLIGGMSWESTSLYYQIINEYIQHKKGGLYSAKCILYSVNFEEISSMQKTGQWQKCGEILGNVAKNLETAGQILLQYVQIQCIKLCQICKNI